MIKVSIIIPVYNTAKYLRKCLDSIINQTLKDIEIICVDNNSTDNSLEILHKYAKNDNRIIIVNELKSGQSNARNTGIKIAKGEYIGFIDSDDWICKDYFEKLYEAATLYEADIACAPIKRLGFLHNSYKVFYDDYIYTTNIQEKINISGIPTHNYICNKIYRKETFHQLGFKQKNMYFEDIDLSIKLITEMGALVTVPKINYYYRIRYGSIVSKIAQTSKKKKDFRIATANCFKYANKHGISLNYLNAYPKKKVFKVFGINLLKRYYYYSEKLAKYKLFGFILFLSIRKA